MLKPFTKEGRFESGFDNIVRGKVWAFVDVMNDQDDEPPYRLGVAIANEQGYHPVPIAWCHADNYDEMADHADALNVAEGLGDKQAALIVCSSMFKK